MKKRRTTRTVRNRSRKREDGRPCGTLKRFPFEQTRLGFMLRYEMPVVYRLLRRLCPAGPRFEPDWQVVDAVARLSGDTSYRKPKFRRYLEEYARTGVYCRRGKRLTPSRREYYRNLCRRKMEEYILRNRKKLRTGMDTSGGSVPREIRNFLEDENAIRCILVKYKTSK